MDMHGRITKWAKTLGYRGDIPISIQKICNPSTYIIWEQLLQQVQPKQKVQHVRYNNLIVRLQRRTNSQRELYPIKEIDLWKEKCKLQQKIDEIKENIRENERIANHFSNEHKIKAMKMKKIKNYIKECEGKAFLLRKRYEAYQKEFLEVEEKLTFFRNLTPVETGENEQNVDETLKECVEKIQMLLLQQELKAPILTSQKSSFGNIFAQSDCSLEDYSQHEEYKNDIANDIQFLNNKDLSKDIKAVLYNTDSQSILNVLLKEIDILKSKLLYTIINPVAYEEPPLEKDWEENSIMELQALQIENELYALQYEKEIKKLNTFLESKEDYINDVLKKMNMKPFEDDTIRELLLLRRKEVGLNALCECVEKQLVNCRSVRDATDELLRINTNVIKMQQNLVDNLRNVNYQYELYKKMYKSMLLYREETKLCVRKLSQFTGDIDWLLPLTYSLHSKEIQVFKKFPLEYNRRLTASDPNLYLRDIMVDIAVDVETIKPETLQILLLLIDCPYNAPEMFIYRLWEKKMKLQAQKSLRKKIEFFDYKTYTIKDLEKQESFIDYAIEKFNEITKKSAFKPSNTDLNLIRDTTKLWLEMPFAKYILKNKLYEGKNITYYQSLYGKYYDQITS